MIKEDLLFEQYQALRDEVIARVKLLHNILTVGVVFLFIYLILITVMLYSGADIRVINFILLCMPVIFSFLTFNYQANQMTMEAIAKYSDQVLKEFNLKAVTWDKFYGNHKREQRMTSFLKVIPLLAPQIIPLIIYIALKGNVNMFFIADSILFLVCIINFRYKLQNIDR